MSNYQRFFILLVCFYSTGCDPIPSHVTCNLPYLETGIEILFIDRIDTWGIYSNYCPSPIEREFKIKGDYGYVEFEWWGDPHRLYIIAKSVNNEKLELLLTNSLFRLEAVNKRSGKLSKYTNRITFPSNNYSNPNLSPVEFTLSIQNERGEVLDAIDMIYSTQKCTCVENDSI